MQNDSNKVTETIQDLESCKATILERHSDNPSLCLRFDSVFKQLINSLNYNTGALQSATVTFKPEPLTKMIGRDIDVKVKTGKLELKPLEVDEIEVFKEKIQSVYDSFLTRENTDLLDSLQDIEIRGVAKLARVPNFEKVAIDGKLIDNIKKAITAKNELEAKKAEELKNLSATK